MIVALIVVSGKTLRCWLGLQSRLKSILTRMMGLDTIGWDLGPINLSSLPPC